MDKFHINKQGEAAKCRATKKACPLGGEHFDSAEDAMISTYGDGLAGHSIGPASNQSDSISDVDRDQLRKQKQLELVLEKNPMHDDHHVGIRKLEDIKTLEDAYRHDVEEELNNSWTDQPDEIYEQAFKTGVITVYSSKNFQEGDFVSTSYNEAEQYAGEGGVNSMEVPLEHVAWIDSSEGMYAPVDVAEEAPEVDSRGAEVASALRSMDNLPLSPEIKKRIDKAQTPYGGVYGWDDPDPRVRLAAVSNPNVGRLAAEGVIEDEESGLHGAPNAAIIDAARNTLLFYEWNAKVFQAQDQAVEAATRAGKGRTAVLRLGSTKDQWRVDKIEELKTAHRDGTLLPVPASGAVFVYGE